MTQFEALQKLLGEDVVGKFGDRIWVGSDGKYLGNYLYLDEPKHSAQICERIEVVLLEQDDVATVSVERSADCADVVIAGADKVLAWEGDSNPLTARLKALVKYMEGRD